MNVTIWMYERLTGAQIHKQEFVFPDNATYQDVIIGLDEDGASMSVRGWIRCEVATFWRPDMLRMACHSQDPIVQAAVWGHIAAWGYDESDVGR